MKTTENFLWQGLILSLTIQLALSLMADSSAPRSPSAASSSSSQGIVGSLYRSAAIKANPEKDTSLTQSPRGQRCVRCGTTGYYGGNNGYADRYYDDYYYRDRGAYYGREDPYRDPYYSRDRNWYYQPDYRSPYDRKSSGERDDVSKNLPNRSYNSYDDRSYGRGDQYYRDPATMDTRYNSNFNSYRGNGYDNLNPTYYEAMRDRFQRDRGYGYDQYYDRFYDRPGYRTGAGGYYDNRNFRPYDETYRGTAGFDNSGRGYYFANQQGQREPPNRQPYPPTDPYVQAQRPQAHPSQIDHYNPQQSHSQYTTPRISPEFYEGKPAPSSHEQTVTSGAAIGVVDSNSSKDKTNSNKEIDDKEKASPSYGRPSLGSSYLFERTNDEENAGSGLSPPMSLNTDEKKPESANMEMKSE